MGELRTLLPYLWVHRRAIAAGLVLVVVSNLFATVGPRFLQQAIDGLGPGQDFVPVRRAVLLLVAVALLGGLARYGMRELLNGTSRRIETDLRRDLFAHLARLSAQVRDRYPTGDLMARATNDLLSVRMVAGPAIMYLVDTVTRTAMVLPMMATISPRLTALALVPVSGLPVAMIVLGRRIHNRSMEIQSHFSTISSFVHEHLSGVRVVRAYQQEASEAAHFSRLNEEYVRRNVALARLQGIFHSLLTLFGGLGMVVLLLVGGGQVMRGTVTVGEFVAFSVYLMTLVWPMIALGWAINLVQRGTAAIARLNQLLAEAPGISSPAVPRPLAPAPAGRALEFEGVWFRYPGAADRGWVLRDVSFRVAAGEALAVVGATGAGKSTLADLIVRTYDPDRGRILLDGVDLRDLDLGDLRRAIGFVPQETFLFSETVRDNVLLGAPDDGRLERAAEVSHLAEALPALPSGYDTLLGERGINLSGGQKQRTALARALVKDPDLFVLDDCLSAVDAQTEARILDGLRHALDRKTSVLISHRLTAVREADHVIVLERGEVVERGTPAGLAAAQGRYWELLRRQQLEEELEAVG